jgi:predicted phage tail protein
MSKSGIVNVRMVITEEKIISNIDKVQKLINPNNKKKIIQLEEDTYFKDLIESIKTYLIEYPKKKNFPVSVYNAAYGLVEFAINQFEENTKRVEELIKQREENIALAGTLNELIEEADNKEEGWKVDVEEASDKFPEEIIESLNTLGRCKGKTSQKYNDSMKILKAKANNLESNLHIEIDMERLEDSSKALSFIGIEVSDALKLIPTPEDNTQTIVEEEVEPEVQNIEEVVETKKKAKKVKAKKEKVKANVQTIEENNEVEANEAVEEAQEELNNYKEETTFKAKPSLWQRFKNSKIVRAATYVFRIRIRIELPSNALPEGRGENE